MSALLRQHHTSRIIMRSPPPFRKQLLPRDWQSIRWTVSRIPARSGWSPSPGTSTDQNQYLRSSAEGPTLVFFAPSQPFPRSRDCYPAFGSVSGNYYSYAVRFRSPWRSPKNKNPRRHWSNWFFSRIRDWRSRWRLRRRSRLPPLRGGISRPIINDDMKWNVNKEEKRS